ncbi:hypothetical protein KFL_005910055 [Klebsormidium nitens]|uniref:Uncharacterized protein n=1 Tax=Klebsormidium nitens TaxID=105231 RepID=A0A1Y1IKS6_KLENI|nr:hypothetical protein KFL_005910055 [Klebsormidium nitens]|eukprot:GAQ90029.1 hypothetical protein KFL_005910055 [Klebsormidium nitens]
MAGSRCCWRPLGCLLVVLLTCGVLPQRDAAVLGIDYGAEWLKMVVVKSGKPMISTVINEMSKRKAPAMVAFSNGERLLGEEAAAIVGRYPERVYQRVRDLLGVALPEARALLAGRYLAYDLVEDAERRTVRIRTHDGSAEYGAEELAAMVLRYAAELARAHSKAPIRDCVLTVPPFWGQRQRQALLDAAHIAGLKVMALLTEPSAAALQYGIDRKFENATQLVLLYDVGAAATRATLLRFSAYAGKDRGRSAVIGQAHTLGVRWDPDLGGQAMEARLAEHFADEFNQQVGGGTDVRASPKAMAKLLKAVRKTKEVLSANSEAPISVESLLDDHDFRSSITRRLFEQLCADVWTRALAPLRDVLAEANITAADLDALEVIGGATRVPRLQAALTDFLGDVRGVDRHLDADEAVAHGAGLHAANLSDGFKLRPFGVNDGLPYGLVYRLDGARGSEDASEEGAEAAAPGAPRSLFPPLRKLPTRIIRSLKAQEDDFGVALAYDPAGPLPAGMPSLDVAQYAVRGVAAATAKYRANATAPLKVALHFSLSRAGVAALDKAELVVETLEALPAPAPPPNASVNVTGNASSANQSVPQGDAAAGEGAEGAATGNGTEAGRPAVKHRKRTLRIPLEVADVSPASLRGMEPADLAAAAARHEELRARDQEKHATAEAKNSLEAYILQTRTNLAEEEGVAGVSTAAERGELEAELAAAEEWLYGEGADGAAPAFQDRHTALRRQGDRIFFRLQEQRHRPQIVARAHALVARARRDVAAWRESRPWVGDAELAGLLAAVGEFEEWVAQQEAAQAGRRPEEDPAFACADVDSRASALLKKIRKVEAIPKPKPKPKPKVNVTTSGDDSTVSNETSQEAGAPETEEAASEELGPDEGAGGEEGGEEEDAGAKKGASNDDSGGLEDEESRSGHDEL